MVLSAPSKSTKDNRRGDLGSYIAADRGRDRRSVKQRIRDDHFGDSSFFDTSGAGFSPMPWLYRKLLFAFKPRDWMVFSWLLMSVGPESVCRLDEQELMDDMQFGSIPRLRESLGRLENIGAIRRHQEGRKTWIAVVHPMEIMSKLETDSSQNPTRLAEINEFFDSRYKNKSGWSPPAGPQTEIERS